MNDERRLDEAVSRADELRDLMAGARRRGLGWLARRLAGEARSPVPLMRRLARATVTVARLCGLGAGWHLRRFLGTVDRDKVHLFYDLQVSPVTYDFGWALLAGEMRRLALGARALTVVIVPGKGPMGLRSETDDYETAVTVSARLARLDRVIVPMCRLLPSVSDVAVCRDRAEAHRIRMRETSHVVPDGYWPSFPIRHMPRQVFEQAAKGACVPRPLRAPNAAVATVSAWLAERARERDVVTITLRDYGYMAQRNSNLDAWLGFARGLDSNRFFAVIIPDPESPVTASADRFEGFAVMDSAATDVEIRLALYEQAYLNLMVNTGPYILCLLSERCRLLMFKVTTAGVPQAEHGYLRYLGFEIDETPGFAGRFQKWIWHDDDRETIEGEFFAMSRLIDQTGPNE